MRIGSFCVCRLINLVIRKLVTCADLWIGFRTRMKKYILNRLGLSVVTMFIVATIVFFLTRILPGNVARRYLGRSATEEDLVNFNTKFGLDKPLLTQFYSWLRDLLTGDLGTSMAFNKPASELLLPAIGYSSRLALMSFLIIVPLSIAGGIIAAMYRGKLVDRILTVGGLSAAVIPEFVWAVTLILVFGVILGVLPVTAFPTRGDPTFFAQIEHLILPSTALLLVLFGYIARITRASVIEALESDYMRTAVLKGLSRRRAVVTHVLRYALLPSIAVIASQVPYLVGGLVTVEIVFNYPGFGTILRDAVGISSLYNNENRFVIVYNLKRLQFNILEHSLVPKVTILTDEEVEEFKKKYNITSTFKTMPEISRFDPQAQAICLRPGQICKFIRNSPTSLETPYYRVCI